MAVPPLLYSADDDTRVPSPQWVTYGSRLTATGTRQPHKPRPVPCQVVLPFALITLLSESGLKAD